jgi:integrase
MGRRACFQATLPSGAIVGYSVKARYGVFKVKFRDLTGKFIEPSTKVEVPKGWTPDKDPPPDFFIEAAKLIVRTYLPREKDHPIKATWEKAIDHLKATPDLRHDSIRGYLTAVKAVRAIIDTKGPNDITVELAHKFKREFLTGTYARGGDPDAAQYKRSPTSCTTYLRSLRSLWQRHWKPAGFVRTNPWLEVPYPNVAKGKRVRLPEETAVADLLTWMAAKFPGWELPGLFVQTKLVAGCRTLDLCKTRSDALAGNELFLTAEVTKTRAPRTIPLPPDLAARLHQIKGPVYLWERSVAESKVHHHSVRTHGQVEYRPETWRNTIQNLFKEFNEGRAKKDRVRPHDLRARAITMVAAATGSVDATAEALGVDPQTARHYLDAAKAFHGSEIMKKLGAVLLPPQNPPHNSEG